MVFVSAVHCCWARDFNSECLPGVANTDVSVFYLYAVKSVNGCFVRSSVLALFHDSCVFALGLWGWVLVNITQWFCFWLFSSSINHCSYTGYGISFAFEFWRSNVHIFSFVVLELKNQCRRLCSSMAHSSIYWCCHDSCCCWCAELQFCVVMMQRNLRNAASVRRHEPTGYCNIALAQLETNKPIVITIDHGSALHNSKPTTHQNDYRPHWTSQLNYTLRHPFGLQLLLATTHWGHLRRRCRRSMQAQAQGLFARL